jgi:hypothetical protein
MRVCLIPLASSGFADIDRGGKQPTLKNEAGKGRCIGMQHTVTSPTYLLEGLIAKCELRELLDLFYDEQETMLVGLSA